MLLAFTWGDELTSKGDTIHDYVYTERGHLMAVFQENGEKFVVVDNLDGPSKDKSDLLLNEITKYIYQDCIPD